MSCEKWLKTLFEQIKHEYVCGYISIACEKTGVFLVDRARNRPLDCLDSLASVNSGGVECDFMAEGYCVKCKAKKEIAEAVEETMKNGRKAIKGKCPTCGVVMFKILGGKASVATTPEPVPAAAAPKADTQPT